VSAYNATVGSLERSLLPSARRMADLGVTGGELTGPREVDDVAKPVTAPALLDDPAVLDPPERPVSVLPTAASG
jgi:DNA recombination protein RmuC